MEVLRIQSWSDLAVLVEQYMTQRWIFRGVDNETHDLTPKIGRAGARKSRANGSDQPFSEAEELRMLARFQRESHPYSEPKPAAHLKHAWELRAVAQHHGLATRLLDWSESPLIAAYFSVERAGIIEATSVNPALYGTPCPYVIESTTDKWPEGQDVVALYPPHLTPRITVQHGLFSVHRLPEQSWQPEILRKWIIPSAICLDIKLALNRAGINRASLFPDLDGIALHLNWLHKWGLVEKRGIQP